MYNYKKRVVEDGGDVCECVCVCVMQMGDMCGVNHARNWLFCDMLTRNVW